MKILLHSGPGFISRAIKLQTRSDWNHASLLFDDGVVFEAREFKGVVRTPLAALRAAMEREPSLLIAVFAFDQPLSPLEKHVARSFAESQLGCPYDYADIARFLTRQPASTDGKWFCSEYVTAACEAMRRPLFRRTAAWEVPPGLIPRSLALHFSHHLDPRSLAA